MIYSKLSYWLLIALLLILVIELPLVSWWLDNAIEGEKVYTGEYEVAGKTYYIYEKVR